MQVSDLPTPALVVDGAVLDANLATMSAACPGPRLRSHVKAFKTTALARRLTGLGHRAFTCATVREVEGMAAAGLGDDLLLANEVVDAGRLGAVVSAGARVTVAVDSSETVAAAAAGGVREVIVDVDVGMPRCGCRPEDAGRVADDARAAGLIVRGVMGYEGHATIIGDRAERAAVVAEAMGVLARAHADVGGDVVSAGSTVTFDLNDVATEIQAGSFALMDQEFAGREGVPFRPAMWVAATVISVREKWAVCDAGLKSLDVGHGDPKIDGADVWIVSDEHITFRPNAPVAVGDRVPVWPTHVDPTVAKHDTMHVVDRSGAVQESWPIDLRGW